MTLGTDLALNRSIDEYVDARNRVLGLIEHGLKAFSDAEALSLEFVPYSFPHEVHGRLGLDECRRRIDARYWQALMDRTGLTSLLDAEAMKAFKRELEDGMAPPFELAAIQTQVLSMHQTADAMFSRGVYNVFRKIRRNWGGHKTNEREPFAVPRKVILSGWFSNWSGLRVNYNYADEVNDVDRIVTVLSGGKYTPRRLESAINAAIHDRKTNHYEDAQLRVKAFENGNAHVWFLDPKTLDKINEKIADYCNGNALVDDAEAA